MTLMTNSIVHVVVSILTCGKIKIFKIYNIYIFMCQNVRLLRVTMILVVSATSTYFNSVSQVPKKSTKLAYHFQV